MLDVPEGDDRSRILSIYQSREDVPADADDVLVVEEIVDGVDADTAESCYGKLFNVTIKPLAGVPVYDIVAHNLWRNGLNIHGVGPFTMNLLLSVNRVVGDAISDESISSVVCYDLDRLYCLAVSDACEAADVPYSTSSARIHEIVSEIRFLLSRLPSAALWLFDMVWSMILGTLFTNEGSKSVAIFYPTGRPDTLEPVRELLDFESDFIVLRKTLSLQLTPNIVPEGLDVRSINLDVSPHTMRSSLRFLLSYVIDTLVTQHSVSAIANDVESTTGVSLPKTINALYRRATVANLPAFFLHLTVSNSFEQNGYQAILYPNNASRGKALAFAAMKNDVALYRLPHSITYPYSIYENTTYAHTVFLEGEIGAKSLSTANSLTPVVSGHPKLIERAKTIGRHRGSRTREKQILIATQPYDDDIRESFTEAVGGAIQDLGYDVCIKIHPGEHRAYYEKLIERSARLDPTRVSVETDDLYRHVAESEAVITITSNVAIESIVADTPSICYNVWEPSIWTPLYASAGAVPCIRSKEDFEELLQPDPLAKLLEREREMLRGAYKVLDTSVEEAAAIINETIGVY